MTASSPDDALARCVEHLLGLEPGTVPANRARLGEWLAAHGYALAPVAEASSFEMAGSFLARRPGGWTVAFGIPPGTLFAPPAHAAGVGGDEVLEAAVLAPLELPRDASVPTGDPGAGLVVAIGIAAEAEAAMTSVQEVRAIAGSGLEGDRYARGAGTFSSGGAGGRALTLVAAEALEELRDAGVELDPLDARRNLVVSGTDLDAMIGRRFRVGEVECLGARRCEPCAHLERITEPGVLRGLVHRGGLRADLLGDGVIRVGDEVVALD